jgi:CcmD family protein
MSYVDAGYIIAFSVLFLYVVSLLVRRRRLERAVANVAPRGDAVQPSASQDGTP